MLTGPKSISKIGMQRERHEFASDNTAAICPEAWAALQEANAGAVPSYGEDEWTQRVCDKVREIFEKDCDVFLVSNGTVANALCLAQLCQSFHSVLCHEGAHIQTDECGAPEFFSKGAKLLLVGGANGKLDLAQANEVLTRQQELHSQKPRAVTMTQATEVGTVYRQDEIGAIAEFARARNLFLHMDGARFANAVAALGCAPKEITWQLGVDALSFGGTKNGLGAGELVIFFRKELAHEFDYRAKQAGQVASKMRFFAAPWLGLLHKEVWLKNARHSGAAAKRLADRLQREAKLEIIFPVEASAIFVRMNEELAARLHGVGWFFYKFIEPDIYRLMCSWATSEAQIDEFVRAVKAAQMSS